MPKRIAFIVDTFPRWSERFIARELQELLRRGVDFSVFCLKSGTEPAESDPEWAGLLERRIVLPSCTLPSIGIAKLGKRYEAARKQLGTFFRRLGCATTLAKLLREGGYGHVHAHFASLPSSLGWLAACTEKDPIPFSFSVHARDLFVDAQLLKEKLADCVRVFACHGNAADAVKKLAAPKVLAMHHGLPLEKFPFMEPPAIKESPEFLCAGRFVPKKGFGRAIESMADARLVARDAGLILMGEGPEQKKYQRRVKALQLDERVEFVPAENGAVLQSMFRRACALLAPFETAADGDVDGIPNIVVEAMALGVPVIGSTGGGLPEVLTEKTGVVLAALAKRPGTLDDALCTFIDAGADLKKVRAARQWVEREFDIRKNIEPMVELFGK